MDTNKDEILVATFHTFIFLLIPRLARLTVFLIFENLFQVLTNLLKNSSFSDVSKKRLWLMRHMQYDLNQFWESVGENVNFY